MPDGRTLQQFRDARRSTDNRPIQLPLGAQANYETLSIMARYVREDCGFPDLRSFVVRDILGSIADTPDNLDKQIDAAYAFCRDGIEYREEGPDTETVADLWSCLYGIDPQKAVGDCAIKSVALATMIGLVSSLKVKPFFVALQQIPDADFYNHVYVAIKRGDKYEAFDPTPPEFRPADELRGVRYLHFPIWSL